MRSLLILSLRVSGNKNVGRVSRPVRTGRETRPTSFLPNALTALPALALALLVAAGFNVRALAEEKRIADADVTAWVQKRVRDWQPTKEERRFDDIAWVRDIREALRLAKEHNRPVFLFTHDGHMAVGRC